MSNTSFPILATKRIVISKDYDDYVSETTETTYVPTLNSIEEIITTTPASSREFTKVKVEFLLKSRENTSLSKWFSDTYRNSEEFSQYAEYLKVHFMALDDSSDILAGYLQNSASRYRTLKNIPSLFILSGRPMPSTASASITFAEILQNEKFTTTPVSDTSNYYEHDIYAEIEMDISSLNMGSTNKVHLVGFIHMDVDSYVRDNGLPPLPDEPYAIESTGGDLIYDLLLERSDSLQVPFYRESLYLNSEPYYGPAHYHSEENPGPDGYIGWMAGYPGQDMGPFLDVITSRNYKVVSSIYDHQDDASVFGLGPLSAEPASSAGTSLESYLNGVLDRDDLLDESRHMVELVRASSYAESKSRKNFMKGSDIPATFINSVVSQDPDTGDLTSEGSHHASVVGLDYFRLVRDMSNYGNIINFHFDQGNTSLVERFLGASKILDIEVLRDRVTNNPYSFNDNDSLDYKVYDIDEPSTRMVSSQDDQTLRLLRPGQSEYKGHLIPASSETASIREIQLAGLDERSGLALSIPGYNRFFHIKDYDLFHNVRFGKYKYQLKLTLIDGVHKTISLILGHLEESYYNLNRYFNDASQPVIKNSEGLYVQGNYDYDIDAFHQSFKERDYSDTISSALMSYESAVEFLTGRKPDQTSLQLIEVSITPQSTNLETIRHVCATLQNLILAMKNFLKATGDASNSEDLKKKGKTYTPSSGPGRKSRTIEVTVKCPDVISALSEGSIVANYSNHQMEDEQGNDVTPDLPNLGLQDYLDRIPAVQGRFTNNLLLPSSYLSLGFTPYSTAQYAVQPGALLPVNSENRVKGTTQPGTHKIVSSYNSYQLSPDQVKSNYEVVVNIARSHENTLSSFTNKPTSELVYQSFTSAGVVVDMVGPSPSGGGSTKSGNSSSAKEKLKDALEQADKDNCLELSDNLKSALQSAAYNGVTRREVMDTAESGYANLNGIIGVIGNTYDNILGLVGSVQNAVVSSPSTGVKPQTEEQKFLNGRTGTQGPSNRFGLKKYSLYDADAAELFVVVPGGQSKKFTPDQAKNWNAPETQGETYLLVMAKPVKREDAVVPVNSGYLLRI